MKMTTSFGQRTFGRTVARASALCLLALAATLFQAREARAQWTTSGTTTSTTNSVGIGTATPSQMFHVHSVGTWAGTRVTTAATGSTFNDGVNFGYDDAYGAYIWNREASPIIFSTNNAERVRVDAAGNVGIGVTSPTQALHVRGKGLVQNTGTASAFVMDRTDGVIASFGAGGNSATFAYDQAGVFKVESNTRANIAAGTFGTGATTRLVIDGAGNMGVGTDAPATKLHVAGNITVDGNINAKYQDVAEWVPSTQKLAAGTVVILDAGRDNHVLASHRAYDTKVAGVISAQPGLSLGEAGEGKVLVATTGRVKVKVDATKGAIKIGDLIVTSDVPGVGMLSQPVSVAGVEMHRPGTIIGKALESLGKGTGEILVLLSLQ